MGSLEETLPLVVGVSPSLHSFSPLPPSEQVLVDLSVEAPSVFLAKLEAVAINASVPLVVLGLVLHYSLSFLLLSL